MAGFANLYVCNGLRQFDDVGVDLHSKNADPITGAAERDPLVERQHFLEHARGLPVRQVRSPLRLEIFQLRRDAAGQGFGQGMDHLPRRRRCLLASTRPQSRALHRHFAVDAFDHRSTIVRRVRSHRYDTTSLTREAGTAPKPSSWSPWEPPQLLHALVDGLTAAVVPKLIPRLGLA
jgi:hypothetical protein